MTLAEILDWHRDRYPQLGAADLYKLLHQGVYGPGHLITDPASAREYLLREHSAISDVRSPMSDSHSLDPGPRPLTPGLLSLAPRPLPHEPLSPDSRYVRINLRGLDGAAVERLLEALLESAREVPTDHGLMRERLLGTMEWTWQRLPRATAELGKMLAWNEPLGFPARHHSPAYQVAYAPAYRVVKPALFPTDV
jgi:hypothetical protein